jgi:mono/diheme cytochrome c family protein
MATVKVLLIPTLGLLALALGWQGHGGGKLDVEDPAQLARAFGSRCASCHAVPDPNFATDRAWLGQLPTTA